MAFSILVRKDKGEHSSHTHPHFSKSKGARRGQRDKSVRGGESVQGSRASLFAELRSAKGRETRESLMKSPAPQKSTMHFGA